MKKCICFKISHLITEHFIAKGVIPVSVITGLVIKKRIFIFLAIACIYLLIVNMAFAQKILVNLDAKQYPNLVYASNEINVSRDLFNVGIIKNTQTLVPVESNIPAINELEHNLSNNQQQCHKWSKTLVYLGTFSGAGGDAAIIQNSQFKTVKVKVGEFIAEQQLTLQKITKTKLVTANTDSSICWLKRLTY